MRTHVGAQARIDRYRLACPRAAAGHEAHAPAIASETSVGLCQMPDTQKPIGPGLSRGR